MPVDLPPEPKGLKAVRKPLADGTVRIYYFDRQTGTALGQDRTVAVERLRDMRDGAITAPPAASKGLRGLVQAFKASPNFVDRRSTTQAQYAYELRELEAFLGDPPLPAITPAVIFAMRDAIGIKLGHRGKANSMLRMLRNLFHFAAKRRLLAAPLATDEVELLEVSPRTEIWPEAKIQAFSAGAPADLQTGMALLYYTVQRLSDVLELTRENLRENDLDGRLWIGLKQSKTDELVWTPCHSTLAACLRALPTDQHFLVPSPRGKQWQKRNFARAWDQHRARTNRRLIRQALEAAPLPRKRGRARDQAKEAIRESLIHDLQRRDLRRTGMVMMALAGATTPQIAAVSGHSIDETAKILETYIPRRGDVAAAAIDAWEAKTSLLPSTGFAGSGNQFPGTGNRRKLRLVNT